MIGQEELNRLLLIAPFHQWLGLSIRSASEDGIEIGMPWREEMVSNPAISATHGGILASLIDLAGLYALLNAGTACTSTADLRVDYHRAATPGLLIAEGRIIKTGRRLSVADTRITNNEGRLVASGRGAYNGA